ncbi:MAG: efflux RND transporter permease subunit [Betaproteobacteria bacterium]|nr:efflux RND transporter permease subunit [Betaproteobacteria bacterium]
MIASLVRFSIRYPGVIVAFALMLVVSGLFTLGRARVDVFPEFSPTQVVIQTEAPGLSPELVEALVTQRLEDALLGVSGLEAIRSQSIPGLSVVTVVFEDGSDIYRNRQVVAERLSGVAPLMPAGVSFPVITPLTSSASTVLGVGLTSKTKTLTEVRTLADTVMRPHLMSVEGVAEVNVFGGQVRQWQLQIDPVRLNRLGISLADVLAAARQATGIVSAGFIPGPNQRIAIVTTGQPATPEVLGRALLRFDGGRTLLLGDVGKVVEGAAEPISAAAINGESGVFVMVQGQLGSNTLAVSRGLESALADLRPLLDREKVTLHADLFRPANFIETAVRNVRFDILIGSCLVVVVLFLILFNARTAFICTTAIPVSLLGAVLLLAALDQPINIMVLGGLAISLGEVVDDAIIDTENIFRRLRENRLAGSPLDPATVALDASVEVRGSVVYATFIVALVFVPLLTFGGIGGKLFSPLGLSYILAILASLFVATSLTPALCYLLLGRGHLQTADPPFVRRIKPGYASLLRAIERHAGRVIGVTGFVIVLGLSAVTLFSGEFVPSLKEGHYVVHMTAVPGTSEREVLRIGNRLTAVLLRVKGVKSVAQWVGRSQNGADTFGPHYSEMEVEVGALDGDEQARILSEIRAILAGHQGAFPGVTFSVNTFLTERIEETISGFPADVAVSIFGADLDSLDHDAAEVAERLAAIPGARDVQVQALVGTPQLEVRFKQDRLTAYGFTAIEVLDAVRTAYEGARVGQIYSGSHPVDVVAILSAEYRRAPVQVGDLPLRSASGSVVRLKDVADVGMGAGRYKILHHGGKRIQTVTANIEARDLDAFDHDLRKALSENFRLSTGNYLVIEGEAEASVEARRRLVFHSLLAGAGIFVLLYLAFNNLRNLSLTFLNLPFALVGGVAAVLLNGGWMTLGSLVGFVTLFGITLRNSIMLVSHYQHLVEYEGLPWNADTMLKGAAERLPSILMTALVTSLGLMPLALGSGQPGREIEGPMAMIIVGGLVTSTVLNLLILPAVLLRFGRFETKPAASN